MKTTRLIHKIQDLMKQPPEETPRKKLCRTLKVLKSKQKDLEKKLKRTEGRHARQRLKQKIEVLRTQRRKGVELYRLLKQRTADNRG
jgi:peptide subunit release factor 1 (eRF1)